MKGNGFPGSIRTVNQYLKEVHGEKLYKLALDAGFTCPNRDGTLGRGGCIFCSAGGSGDFAEGANGIQQGRENKRIGAPEEQSDVRTDAKVIREGRCHVFTRAELDQILEKGKQRLSGKYHGERFIAYLQAYTNTYAPVEDLRMLYKELLDRSEVAGLSIGTRPDCVDEEIVLLLAKLQKEYEKEGKFIWVELGLQTANEEVAGKIRRSYSNAVFEKTMQRLNEAGIPVIVHLILGLPGETRKDMTESVRYINRFQPFGVKFQLLHVLKGTELSHMYERKEFDALSMEEYMELLESCLRELDPNIVVHRMTGDGPKKLLIAPLWSADKKRVMNEIRKRFCLP